MAEHGTAAAALEALPRIAAEAGIDGYEPCPAGVAHAELAAGARAGARLIRFDDPAYPTLLAMLTDAPPVLWMKGRIEAMERPCIAVIGARNASSLGLRMARGLSRGLAEAGLTVTAGLARGIDTAAHEASCEAGTVAVMAGGIDVIYPSENRALAERICEAGCLLTEQPPGLEPVARHFPARNRIVSGLSAGVVVIEAAHRSGSLITARCGAEQGREIMAVPGHPLDARAAGCNGLIRDGATLVRNSDDVIAALHGARSLPAPGWLGDEDKPTSRRDDGRRRLPATPGRGAEGRMGERNPQGSDEHDVGDKAGTTSRHAAPDTCSSARGGGQPRKQDAGRGSTVWPSSSPASATPPAAKGGLRHRLLALLGPSPSEEDSVIRELGVRPSDFAPALLDLELEGRIIRLPGGRIALAE